MKNNLIMELWTQGKANEIIAAEDYIKKLRGEEKLNCELIWAYCILEQQNDSKPYSEVIQKYINQQLPPRALLNVKLHQAAYMGWLRSKSNESLDVLEECDLIYQGLPEKDKGELLFLRAWFFHLKGTFYASKDSQEAINILKKGLAIFDENPHYKFGLILKSAILNHMGNLYSYIGEYEKSERFYRESIDLATRLGNESFQSLPLGNISLIYSHKGEIQKAMEYLEAGYKIAENNNTLRVKTELLGSKGDLYIQLRKYNLALNCYKEALDQAIKLQLVSFEARTRYQIIIVLSILKEDNWKNKIKEYINDLEKLVESSSSKMIETYYQLSRVIFLKYQPRLKEKFKAQEILEKIINDTSIDYSLQIQAMLYQCELLLLELKILEERELLNEINNLLDQITLLAKDQSLIIIEILILRAAMVIIQGKGKQAFEYLDRAMVIAQKMNLKHYIQKIDQERNKINAQIKAWNNLSNTNITIGERLKQLEIQEYLTQAIEISTLHSHE